MATTEDYVAKFDSGGSPINTGAPIFDDDTNVGIGTTSPACKLHVFADDANNAANLSNVHTDGYGVSVRGGGSDAAHYCLSVKDKDSNVLMTAAGNGNIGIGTTSPAAMLSIETGASDNAMLIKGSGTNNIYFKALTGSDRAYLGYNSSSNLNLINASNGKLNIGTNNADVITILSDGNVGIGTTSPATLLHIEAATTAHMKVVNTGNNDAAITVASDRTTEGNPIGAYQQIWDGTIVADIRALAGPNTASKNEADLQLRVANSGALAEAIRIKKDGNVGINDSSPSYKLDVNGTGRFTGAVTLDSTLGVTGISTLATGSTVGNLTLANGSITDSSGAISFGNENLSTTGTLSAGVSTLATGSTVGNLTLANGSITDSSGAISFGNENLSTTGTLSAGVSTLATGSTVGNLTLADGSITDSSGAISFGNENLSTTGTLSAGAITGTSTSLGTGELTAGSINRATGTLTLEIGGTAEISVTSTATTLACDLDHDGSQLNFFNTGSLATKTSVSDPSAIVTTGTASGAYGPVQEGMLNNLKTDVTNLQSKLTDLINALQSYGLV